MNKQRGFLCERSSTPGQRGVSRRDSSLGGSSEEEGRQEHVGVKTCFYTRHSTWQPIMLHAGQDSLKLQVHFLCRNVNDTIIVKDPVELVHKRPVWRTKQVVKGRTDGGIEEK